MGDYTLDHWVAFYEILSLPALQKYVHALLPLAGPAQTRKVVPASSVTHKLILYNFEDFLLLSYAKFRFSSK